MVVERATGLWGPVQFASDAASDNQERQRLRSRRPIPIGGFFGVLVTGLVVLLAIAGQWLVAVDPASQDLTARLAPPVGFGGTWAHPLGTDGLGRDLLARLVAGARLSLLIGVVATLAAGTIGVSLGLLAGFGGGVLDRVVTWFADVQMALPFVIVAVAITVVLGNGVSNVVLALALTGWVGYARVIRLQSRSLRRSAWVDAARSLGASPLRIALRHLLPNLVPTIVILATQQVSGMILYEAALSYLGLGAGGDVITWGGMVATGQEVMLKAWWVSVLPGIALAVTVLGLNASGDWLSGPVQRR
jgi:peptide/nickel transport system permease protein